MGADMSAIGEWLDKSWVGRRILGAVSEPVAFAKNIVTHALDPKTWIQSAVFVGTVTGVAYMLPEGNAVGDFVKGMAAHPSTAGGIAKTAGHVLFGTVAVATLKSITNPCTPYGKLFSAPCQPSSANAQGQAQGASPAPSQMIDAPTPGLPPQAMMPKPQDRGQHSTPYI